MGKELILTLLMQNKGVYRILPEKFRDDTDIYLAACESGRGVCSVLKYATKRIQDNEDLVLCGIHSNNGAFAFASKRLRAQEDTCYKACQISMQSYKHSLFAFSTAFPNSLQKKLFSEGFIYHTCQRFQNDRELLKTALRARPFEFRYCETDVKDDEEIAKLAISLSSYNECYQPISDRLKNDRDLAIFAAKKEGHNCNFRYFLPKFKDDEEIARIAIATKPSSFAYVSDRLRNNEEFVFFYVKTHWAFYADRKHRRCDRFPLIDVWSRPQVDWHHIPDHILKSKKFAHFFMQHSLDSTSLKVLMYMGNEPTLEMILNGVKQSARSIIFRGRSYRFENKFEELIQHPEVVEMAKRSKAAFTIFQWYTNLQNRSFKLAAYAILRLKRENKKLDDLMLPKRLRALENHDEQFWRVQEKMENEIFPLIEYISNIKKRKFL